MRKICSFMWKSPPLGYNLMSMTIAEFVKEKRKEYGLTQMDLSIKTG